LHAGKGILTGFDTRPIATFSGLRGVPLLALSHNALFPALRILPHGIRIRVIRAHELAYDDLATVDFAQRLGWQVTFVPRQGLRTFTAVFAGRNAAVVTLAMLHRNGGPLGTSAKAPLMSLST